MELSGDVLCLIKIDVAKLGLVDVGTFRQIHEVGSIFCVSPDTTPATAFGQRVTFDGRDIWVIPEIDDSQTNSGDLIRLPLALIRS